jgi:pimeloyl-ACP methyl ester carboxylesterase
VDRWTPYGGEYELGMYRYDGRTTGSTDVPVVLCHGLAQDHSTWDGGPSEAESLAKYLANRGRDVWVVDLRGSGLSKGSMKEDRDWRFSFEDLVYEDVPAILSAVLAETRQTKVDWVGHSMGGMVTYAFATTQEYREGLARAGWYEGAWRPLPPDAFRSVVVAGSPASFRSDQLSGVVEAAAQLKEQISSTALRFSDRVSPEELPLGLGTALSLVRFHPRDTSKQLLEQFADMVRRKELVKSRGAASWTDELRSRGLPAPYTFIIALDDELAPFEDVRTAADAARSYKECVVVEGGHASFFTPEVFAVVHGQLARTEFPRTRPGSGIEDTLRQAYVQADSCPVTVSYSAGRDVAVFVEVLEGGRTVGRARSEGYRRGGYVSWDCGGMDPRALAYRLVFHDRYCSQPYEKVFTP